MTAEAWWQRDPGRLQREEGALRAAGLPFRRADAAFTHGVAQFLITVDGPDGPVELTATFPDTYPYFKPFVTGPDLGLGHHWNPVTGEMCLLRGSDWRPGSDTLARLLTEQWPRLLVVNADDGIAPDGRLLEHDQAEPVTAYMHTLPGSHLVIDLPPELPEGCDSGRAVVLLSSEDPVRGFVGSFLNGAGEPLLPDGARVFAGHLPSVQATWVRLKQAPLTLSAADVWAAVAAVRPGLDSDGWAPRPSKPHAGKAVPFAPHLQIVLVTLPEETARRQLGMGWVGLLRVRENMRKPPRRPQLVRIVRAGRAEILERAPQLRSMAEKKLVIVGAGGLGSAVILELGRTCAREIVVVDGDLVEAAAAVRFASALRFAGASKTQALGALVCETQPYTDTTHSIHSHIGAVRLAPGEPDQDALLREKISTADLVIDATAEVRTQHYVSDTARRLGVAYLQTEATPGVWAGLVALYRPNRDLCWMCVQHHLDTTIAPLPANLEPGAQPPGCPEPTYTGAGFDLATIGSHAARVAVAYLTGADGYGAFEHDFFTVELRDRSGTPLPAKWTGHHLARHPSCDNHTT